MLAGIDIGASTIKFGIVAPDGEVLFKNHKATPRHGTADEIFNTVLICGEALLLEASENDWQVPYIGVGSPGIIDLQSGTIRSNCPNLPHWIGFPLGKRLEERLNIPVHVENDANCALVGEHRFGCARGVENCLMLTVGTGLGGALIIGGRLYRGSDGAAGEFGQMRLLTGKGGEFDSRTFESIVSSRGMLARYRQLNGKTSGAENVSDQSSQSTIRKLFGAARSGDRNAQKVIRDTGRFLGAGLANLVQMLNPELVVLGGGVTEGGKIFVDEIRQAVTEMTMSDSAAGLSIRTAELGNRAGFIGAAVIREYREG
jgi:glucokinase